MVRNQKFWGVLKHAMNIAVVKIHSFIASNTEDYKRYDIVYDRYLEGSLKEGIRNERGSKGTNIPFGKETKVSN